MKVKPTGFIARCQCGIVIGAMDILRSDRKEAGKIIGEWLNGGCVVEPKFGDCWSETLGVCQCDKIPTSNEGDVS